MPVIVLIFLLSIQVHAVVLYVESGFRKFTVTFEEQRLDLRATGLNTELILKECNKAILKRFNEHMNLIPTKGPLLLGRKDQSINFTLNDKQYHEPKDSIRGKILNALPNEFIRMKSEEALACKRKS